jgi:urate oxidase
VVTVDGRGEAQKVWVVSGFTDLVVLKSTRSEFKGFLRDKYTTLQETDDRIMATSLTCLWRYEGTSPTRDAGWDEAYEDVKRIAMAAFATTYSRALQETLYVMGKNVLEAHPEIAEIKFSAPNKHHFLVDLSPFDLENNGEVFIAADRPYGLIEATLSRDDASEAGMAWQTVPGFV